MQWYSAEMINAHVSCKPRVIEISNGRVLTGLPTHYPIHVYYALYEVDNVIID